MASSRDQIKDLFFAALELPAADRPKFLADIDDAALRAEVMALVEGHDRADRVREDGLESDLIHRSTLHAGQRLGPYEIADCIGSGGLRQRAARRPRTIGA